MPATDAYIALGTNVEPMLYRLREAVSALNELGTLLKVSSVYSSEAYGYTNQSGFLNAAVLLRVEVSAPELLKKLKALEQSLGRLERPRWQEREIDFDIILFGKEVLKSDGLSLPHPDYHNRSFVVYPLLEIAPNLIDPESGQSLRSTANGLINNIKQHSDSLLTSTNN